MPFENTTAIVTGGASGMGLACVEALAARGTKVAIFDVQQELLHAEVERLTGAGHTVAGYVVDVTDRAAIEAAVGQVAEQLGDPLILVNNAGVTLFKRFLNTSFERWQKVHDVNLAGTFHMCQVVIPYMQAAKWGRIVNVSSSSTHGGQPYMSAYVASKSAVVGLTKSLALELGPDGITVNHVPPGFINTPMSQAAAERGEFGPGGIEEAIARTPVRRMGEGADIANAVVFLCQDESSYITGQYIGVNGGRNT